MWSVKDWYDKAASEAAARKTYYHGMADVFIDLYERNMPGASRDEVIKILAKCNADRLAALPDLDVYPELRGMDQLVDARWRGVRDGAELNDAQWAAQCNATFYYHRFLNDPSKKQAAKCSVVFFADSDRGPLFASNLDSCPEEPHGSPSWPAINEHLIVGGVSSGVYCDETSPEIFPAPVSDLVGRYCRTTAEAVEMYQRYNYFWGPGNLMVADRSGDVVIFEKSACRMGVRRIEGGFAHVTAMTAQDPAFRSYLYDRRDASLEARGLPRPCADTAYWDSAQVRHHLMGELLDDAKAAPTIEKLQKLMQFRDEKRGFVAVNGDIIFPGGEPVEHTLRTSIFVLREGKCLWWSKDGDTPSWENPMPDGEYEDVWTW